MDVLKDQQGLADLLSNMYMEKLNKGNFDKDSNRRSLRRVITFIRLIVLNSNAKEMQLRFVNNKVAESTIKWCSEVGRSPSIHAKVISLLCELLMSKNE